MGKFFNPSRVVLLGRLALAIAARHNFAFQQSAFDHTIKQRGDTLIATTGGKSLPRLMHFILLCSVGYHIPSTWKRLVQDKFVGNFYNI